MWKFFLRRGLGRVPQFGSKRGGPFQIFFPPAPHWDFNFLGPFCLKWGPFFGAFFGPNFWGFGFFGGSPPRDFFFSKESVSIPLLRVFPLLFKPLILFNLSRGYASYMMPILRIKAEPTLISFNSDYLFFPKEMEHISNMMSRNGQRVKSHNIDSSYGPMHF